MSDGPTYRGGEDKVAVPISGTEAPVVPEILDKIERMGVLARSEVSQSKQAFALRGSALAEDLVRQDEQINQLNRDIFRRAVDVGIDPDTREWAMTMMLVARALEQIGDNASTSASRSRSSFRGSSASSATPRIRRRRSLPPGRAPGT